MRKKTIGIILIVLSVMSVFGGIVGDTYQRMASSPDLSDVGMIMFQILFVVGGIVLISKDRKESSENSSGNAALHYDINKVDYSQEIRYCARCGSVLQTGDLFCPECGSPVGASNAVNNYPNQGTALTKKEFINANTDFKRKIRNAAIICYVCAGITAIVAMLVYPPALIDAVLLLGLALGMHLGKSKVCAFLILVLACFEAIMGLVQNGSLSGYLWIVAGVLAVITFRKIDKAYKEYCSEKSLFK